jgi:preprotein translocase subunit SecG
MKNFLDFSVNALPWVMVILAGLAFITMIVMLYNQKQQHKVNRKD